MSEFVHLHCHTQYSLLDGASSIAGMMDKAVKDGQKGVALTDHGNMFGAFKFVAEANKRNIKPIIGCEFYLVEDRHKKSFERAKGEKDKRYHQLLLAKNRKGYENLCKLCSLGYMEGLYSKYPRIDKELLLQYSEGLIATSCCIGAEIPQTILQGKEEEAETLLKWWLDLFGDDYYIEFQRHKGLENIDQLGVSQEDINQVLLKFAKKHNVKTICTNDSHYVEEEDWAPHDILLCINTASSVASDDRFKFPSSDFYFKTQSQMKVLFKDLPESVDNTMEIYDKIETLELARDVLLPAFPIPEGFNTQDEFLRHITYEGAKKRYGDITKEISDRLDFELDVIRQSGYPGYFLIVQDFTTTARNMGVSVGPGRGSAAGSAVAYCVGITNVDPIKYDLLFERFLNPERISMPDIDIDFDDVGRAKVIDYVLEKYGRDQVAQIITYGSMAAKSSIRDVGRVLDVPLAEVDKVAKTFPLQLGATLKAVLADGDIDPKLKGKMNSEDVEKAYQFRKLAAQPDHIGNMLQKARKLEGSIRNTGIHACGVVITPDAVTNYVPVTVAKDSDLLVSQFDNSVAEDAGLLKMDFLGLKTLTIIKDAIKLIKLTKDIEIDADEIPLDDELTYKLFQRGDTIGIFQYESAGMQKYMRDLVPNKFEDLIAMNALYRPGPLAYIPTFVNRKHGREEIKYDLPAMEEYLHETYGVCVSGDTLIFNAETGERVRIDELEDQVGKFYVQGVDEKLKATHAQMTHWIYNGVREVLEVKLRNGSTVKLTPDHKVLTEDGWIEIGKLKEGNHIATPEEVFVKDEIDTKEENSNSIFFEEKNKNITYHKNQRLSALEKNTGSNFDSSENHVLDLPTTKKNLNVRWEEIISIKPVGKEKVYDITVEGIHNFVGNNIILHNCVYQEQVMLLSQKLANFSKGEADMLRKAMGKKKKKLIDEMWPKFLEGCTKNNHPEEVVKKVWKDWEAFASYAFNKSHSTCYALIAFQTAYLKAHHPAEFMASVLTHNKNDLTKLTFFLRECKRMGLEVLGPDVNESISHFSVNKAGQIRFGMSALKGVGEGPVEAILKEREKGSFKNVFDMMRRLDLRSFNKKSLDSLVLGGGLDCFDNLMRSQYYAPSEKYATFIEHLLRYGNAYQSLKSQSANSLFGDSEDVMIPEPKIPEAPKWSLIEKLTKEKEVAGIYISGHPLDDYKMEIENYTTCSLDRLDAFKGTQVNLAGVVIAANHRIDKKGIGYGFFEIQDYNGSLEFALWREDYQSFKHLMNAGEVVFIKGKFEYNNYREEYQFRIKDIRQLVSIGEDMTQSITLKIFLKQLDNDLINDLDKVFKEHKGKLPLKMMVLEGDSKTSLQFHSTSRKVKVDNDMIGALDRLGVKYKLNA